MIVRQFIQWLRTASAGDRADATSALARAYLYSDLSPDDRAAAEGAMLMLLDDPSPLVRRALADVFAASQAAPPAVVYALAGDQPEIASTILERSPLLVDADLVDHVATGSPAIQAAIASRFGLPRAVAAAVAEVGTAHACLVLIENPDADVVSFSLDRIVERHGHLAAIREALADRADLPAATRQAMLAKLSATLADFVAAREWLEDDRARRIAKEACERATVALAAQVAGDEIRPLIRHLCASGQLTAGLVLRAVLCGNTRLFEEALAELSGLTLARVSAIVHDRGGGSFRALYHKAGLPPSLYPAFREVIEAMQASGFVGDVDGATRLKRRMIERVLTRCADAALGDIEPLMTLLRRFATEAAREEARLFCDEIAAESVAAPVQRLAAA
ncbi:MAG: DUF2336 domain-containing protein [Rhizobiales bacterium]|nr:DUF2336 domain-containing protein [Hyphomicrobiales bacterium]